VVRVMVARSTLCYLVCSRIPTHILVYTRGQAEARSRGRAMTTTTYPPRWSIFDITLFLITLSIAHLYAACMANADTRRLLLEIDSNEDIKRYLKEACDDLLGIIHCMCMYTCVKAGMPPSCTSHNGRLASRNNKYQHTLQCLMRLGSTQNSTDPGSVRHNDTDGVFAHGNIRERCALLMNMLCHDKKYLIMQWVLERVPTPGQGSASAVPSSSLSHSSGPELVVSGSAFAPRVPMSSLVNISQIVAYKQALARCTDKVYATSVDPNSKKDMRKALCKLVNCPRKNTRVILPLHLQHMYALSCHDIVPKLSLRERDLMRETQDRPPLATLRENWLVHLTVLPPKPSTATSERVDACPSPDFTRHTPIARGGSATTWTDIGSNGRSRTPVQGTANAWDNSRSLVCCDHRKCDNASGVAEAVVSTMLEHSCVYPALPRPAYPVPVPAMTPASVPVTWGHDCARILPWLTGRMCWKMVHDSSFFVHDHQAPISSRAPSTPTTTARALRAPPVHKARIRHGVN